MHVLTQSFAEVMEQDVGFWEGVFEHFGAVLLAALGFTAFVTLFGILLMGRDSMRFYLIATVPVFLCFFLFMGIAIPGSALEKEKEAAAMQNIQENIDGEHFSIVETNTKNEQYDLTVAFERPGEVQQYELKMTYSQEHEIMAPVVAVGYENVPLKEGSELASLMQSSESLSSTTEDQE